MASKVIRPFLFLNPGAEPQATTPRASAQTSGGQGNIADGLWLETQSGLAARADANTVESNVLGFCTGVLNSRYEYNPKGGYLESDEAGYVEYIPDARLLTDGTQFVMGEDGVGTTIQAVIAGGATIAAGLFVSLINSIGSDVDQVSRAGVDASRQHFVQVLDSSTASATQGTLLFQVLAKYVGGIAVPADPTASDTSAADWVVKRVYVP